MKKSIKTLTRLPLLLAFLALAGTPLQSWGQETPSLELYGTDEMYLRSNQLQVQGPVGYATLEYTTNNVDPQSAAEADKTTVSGREIPSSSGAYYFALGGLNDGISAFPDGTIIRMRARNTENSYTDEFAVVVSRSPVPTVSYTVDASTGKATATFTAAGCHIGFGTSSSITINSSTTPSSPHTPNLETTSYQDNTTVYYGAYQYTAPSCAGSPCTVAYPSLTQSLTIHRYQAPTIVRSGDIITVTNPNNYNEDGETTNTSTTLYWYTDGHADHPRCSTAATFTIPIADSTTLTYHFYVGGTLPSGEDNDAIFHSPELVTEIVPTASIASSIPEVGDPTHYYYNLERVVFSGTSSIYYDYFPDGTVPDSWSANTEDSYSNYFTPGSGLNVENAPDGAVYKLYRRLMREEKLMLGTSTISNSTTTHCDGAGVAEPFTVHRYHTPQTTIDYTNYTTPSITASLNTVDVDGSPEVRWKMRTIPTSSSASLSTSGTITGEDFSFNHNFYFRTFGAAKFPTFKGDAAVVSTDRYNPPAIRDYDAYDPGTNNDPHNARGTFVSEEGTTVYICTTNVVINPTVSSSYQHTVPAGGTFSANLPGFTATVFKLRASAANPTKFPSDEVTVTETYSGYYVIHKYDATNEQHHYLSLDSVSHRLRDLDHFDHSCLWFLDEHKGLYQSIQTVKYYLQCGESGSSYSLSASTVSGTATPTPWNISLTNHALTVSNSERLEGNTTYTLAVDYRTQNAHWTVTYQAAGNHPIVVYPVAQRHARAGIYNEIENLRVTSISHVVNNEALNSQWISMVDDACTSQVQGTQCGTATLRGKIDGEVATYHLPDHFHFSFTPSGLSNQEFAFYPGLGNAHNRSYADHTLIPVANDREANHLGHDDATGTLTLEWRLMDGLVYHQDLYPNQQPSLTWGSNGTAITRDGTTVGYSIPGAETTPQIAQSDITLHSLAHGSARTDTVYLVATYTVSDGTGTSSTVSATATSAPFLVNYGTKDATLHVRQSDGTATNFVSGRIYLLANCGDRQRNYDQRHYLTGSDNPDNHSAYLSDHDHNYYRALRVDLNSDGTYTFLNVGRHDNETNTTGEYLVTRQGIDYFQYDETHPSTYFAATPSNSGEEKYVITPYHESDDNDYILITPYFLSTGQYATPGASLCPVEGANNYDHLGGHESTHTGLEGATLRIGNGLNSYQSYKDDDESELTHYAFSQDYFYGAYWQLVVPTLLEPLFEMDPLGYVTFTSQENTIRHIHSNVKYKIYHEATGTWDDTPTTYDLTNPPTGDSRPLLAAGDKIEYWKVGARVGDEDFTYLHDSPHTTFTAVKMDVNTVSAPTVRNNTFIFNGDFAGITDQDGINDLEDVRILYTIGEATEPGPNTIADVAGYNKFFNAANPSRDVNATGIFRYCAYARNRLYSDVASMEQEHIALLPLTITATTADNVTTVKFLMADGINTNDYFILFTDNGTKPTLDRFIPASGTPGEDDYTPRSVVPASGSFWWDDPAATYSSVGYPISANSDITMLRAIAFPTDENHYRTSKEQRHYNYGQYMSFCHVDNIGNEVGPNIPAHQTSDAAHDNHANHDFHMMLIDRRVGETTYNRAVSSHTLYDEVPDAIHHQLDSTFIFRGPSSAVTPNDNHTNGTAIYNATCGGFLSYDANGNVIIGNANNPTQWWWGGEQTSNNPDASPADLLAAEGNDVYTLYTIDANNQRRYLVYDSQEDKWIVVQADNATSFAAENSRYKAKVAYRTDFVNYPGGQEFSPKGMNLFIVDGDNNIPLSTEGNAWMAYNTGDVTLRASLQGNQITYKKNIDINIHRYAFDDRSHPENDYDYYTPWQQWHQDGDLFTHYYWDVTGYSNVFVEDAPLEGTVTWTLGGDDNNTDNTNHYWQLRVISQHDPVDTENAENNVNRVLRPQIARLTRADQYDQDANGDNIPLNYPNLNTLLTVNYQHDAIYANDGQRFNRDVPVLLVAERALTGNAAAINGEPKRIVSKADVTNNTVLSAGVGTLAASAGETCPFLINQSIVGVSTLFSQDAVWSFKRTRTGSAYIIQNQGHPSYCLYNRPNGQDGLYLLDPDHNTNSRLYNYIQNDNPDPLAAGTTDTVYGVRTFSGYGTTEGTYVALQRSVSSTPRGSDLVYAANGAWRNIHYGAAVATTVTDGVTTVTPLTGSDDIKNDFWSCRWKLENAPLTPPVVRMAPDGTVTLSHSLEGAEGYNLKYYFKILDAGDANPATLFTSDGLETGVKLYGETTDPQAGTERPVLTLGKKIVVSVANWSADGNTRSSYCSYVDQFTPERTAAPTVSFENGFVGEEGVSLTVGVDQPSNRIKWDDAGDGSFGSTGNTIAASVLNPYLDNSHILTVIAWRQNELQSEERYLAHQQTQILAITSATTTYTPGTPATLASTITGTIEISGSLTPQANYTELRYTLDDPAEISTSHPGTLVDFTVSGNTFSIDNNNVVHFTFQVTETNVTQRTLRLRVIPANNNFVFYAPSNTVTQVLVDGSHNTAPSIVDGYYQIATAADYVAVANLINAANSTYKDKYYKVTADIDLANLNVPSIDGFEGKWDGGYHVISHLKNPMFGTLNNAHVYNVVIDRSRIVDESCSYEALGALCIKADGATRIYNSGFRNTDGESELTTNVKAGGLVGKLTGTARVINCYNFAPVTSTGNCAAGIVGYFDASSKSGRTTQNGVVFCCVNYAKITASTDIYPVVSGISYTDISGKFNTYNYFNADADYVVSKLKNDGSFGNEEWAFNRMMMVPYIMNSNNRRCGWWAGYGETVPGVDQPTTGDYFKDSLYADKTTIGQWVLDTTIAPYPIIKRRYKTVNGQQVAIQYHSIINPNYEDAARNDALPYQGRRMTDWGTVNADGDPGYLKVNVKKRGTNTNCPNVDNLNNFAEETKTEYYSITDMDTLCYDFNYAKIQLPYYQDVFTDANSNIQVDATDTKQDWIVTGWIITSIKRNDKNTAWVASDSITANNCTWIENFKYNYADRKSVFKDIYTAYTKSKDAYGNTFANNETIPVGRVFAQGGFFNVPYGVTEITIEPYWGRVCYLMESNKDVYYDGGTVNTGNTMYGSYNDNDIIYGTTKRVDKHIFNSSNIFSGNTIKSVSGKCLKDNVNVYDQAIVLLSDFHTTGAGFFNKTRSCTVTSIDRDNDHVPDYVLYDYFVKEGTTPMRLDNIVYADLNMAGMSLEKFARHVGLPRPKGHFEVTETALAHFYQIEYMGYNTTTTSLHPVILNGGYFEHITTDQKSDDGGSINTVAYLHMGGYVYHKQFSPASDPNGKLKHFAERHPIILTGGEYKEFYLSGILESKKCDNTSKDAILHVSGARIGKYASGGYERINANVVINADHVIADEFIAGGIAPKADYAIQGSISTRLDSSIVYGVFCGGNKFGDITGSNTVETHAKSTRFNVYYGAGYGGNATMKYRHDNTTESGNSLYNVKSGTGDSWPQNTYYRSIYNLGAYLSKSGTNYGIATDYEMDFFPQSQSYTHWKRYYAYYSTLSLASCNDVTSILEDCTLTGDYYGGGNMGEVKRTATSTLKNCTVHGNVYAGGNSATTPPVVASKNPTQKYFPEYVGGVYLMPDHKTDTLHYYWTNSRSDVSSNWSTSDYLYEQKDSQDKVIKRWIYASSSDGDLTKIGQCNNAVLTIEGNTKVYGKVFGGGNEAPVNGTAQVTVKDNAYIESDVFGGGNVAAVNGNCTVVIGEAKPTDAGNDYNYAEHRPWVLGDVYGGGNEADIKGGSDVTIYDGIVGPVYGGGNEGSVLYLDAQHPGDTKVKILGGWVGYRPNNLGTSTTAPTAPEGTIYHLVNIDGTWWDYNNPVANIIESNGVVIGRDKAYYGVFGGGFGLGTVVAGKAHVHIGKHAAHHPGHNGDLNMNADVHVYGSVYGGGEAGQVGGGYKALHLKTGATVPANSYVFNTDGYPDAATDDKAVEGTDYYSFITPTFGTDDKALVTISADDNHQVVIEGAAFGGGRGYFVNLIDNEEDHFVGTEGSDQLAMAGAVYGNTNLIIGEPGQARERVLIHSLQYFIDKEIAAGFGIVDQNSLMSGASYWDETLFIFNMLTQRYERVTPGEPYKSIPVKATAAATAAQLANNSKYQGYTYMNLSSTKVVDSVEYYVLSGRVSAAGGGERGPVYGSTAFNDNGLLLRHSARSAGDMTGGNAVVTLYSGTLGDILDYEVDGDVFGGGLQATVDGTTVLNMDAERNTSTNPVRKASESLWVRGDTYAGGCLGEVCNYANAKFATQQTITGGWTRNAYGGSNLTVHNSRANTKLVVGAENGINEDVLVSESVYGSNAYSASNATATMEMHSGRVGFLFANEYINTSGPEEKDRDAIAGTIGEILPNGSALLSYEGNVYGGGFGPNARTTQTTVTVDGGIIRNGVFGGGEVAPVYHPSSYTLPENFSGNDYSRTRMLGIPNDVDVYVHKYYDANGMEKTVPTFYVKQTDPLTTVDVSGGQMSMVCGGGRGYTGFLKVGSNTPGAIMGNTSVTVSGTLGTGENPTWSTVISGTTYGADLGGGNIYGGGLEGIVTGNTNVTITGGHVTGNAFAGGRGYRGEMMSHNGEDITDRSSRQAGWVLGNTRIEVKNSTGDNPTSPTIDLGVYGGGEGLIYHSVVGTTNRRDTVANVHGHANVIISGGTLGGGYKKGYLIAGGSYAGGRVASIHGYANMLVSGTADVASVYGGNDITGKVYGYGRPATAGEDETPDPDYLEDSYDAAVTSDRTSTYVSISGNGVKVGHVYGGGNGKYSYYNDNGYSFLHLTPPVQPSTLVDIHTTGGRVNQAFGGGNMAVVNNATIYYHASGFVDTLFAGGNSATVTTRAIAKLDKSDEPVGEPSSSPAPLAAKGESKDASNAVHVKYLFGGNNQATMTILPEIELLHGKVYKVYGGGNAGAMEGKTPVEDVFGRTVPNVSTYLKVMSNDVVVTDAIFGGCNNANVKYTAYVDVREGDINRLFGGNDVSADVKTTRIDMLGGTVQSLFGGGNGYYNYYLTSNGRYDVTEKAEPHNSVVVGCVGRPFVEETHVNIWGGTVDANIFGGGYAGNCRNTHVEINDKASYNGRTLGETYTYIDDQGDEQTAPVLPGGNAHITGKIFGGGFGDKSLLGTENEHVGCVTGYRTDRGDHSVHFASCATTDLHQVNRLDQAYAYGGGEAGDVEDAVLTVYPTWNQPLIALYGGCWGADVKGTTTVNMRGAALQSGYNVESLYGGNDYTGTVNKSILNVYDGKYQYVYGAGNGRYTYPGTGDLAHVTDVPNSMFPTINFYDGTVDKNMYGGGNMGTCFVGPIPENVTQADRKTADDYAHVVVNVHGGQFNNDIYAGAAGEETLNRRLITGLKQLNMDGGVVEASVYGGSQSVPDGYEECKSVYQENSDGTRTRYTDAVANHTTKRPSSILNLVGGTIKNNVYGAGYLGVAYGSVYVNVGREAVNTSPVWTNTYAGTANTYAAYKPTLLTYNANGENTESTLKPSNLYLWHSIYNGANWGEGGGSFQFSTPGFFGGESRILIDGLNYNTSSSSTGSDLPALDVHYSLIGAGTSCEGGDVHRNITVRNYGVNEGCEVSKELFSIQRADSVLLQNTAFDLIGDQDAYSAYASTRYSFNRCDTIVLRDYNTLFLSTAAVNMKHLEFSKSTGNAQTPYALTTASDISALVPTTAQDACAASCSIIPNRVDPTTNKYSLIYIKNGVYIDVKDLNGVFGDVAGYGLVVPEDATRSVITARYKTDAVNTSDGGFLAICSTLNDYPTANPVEYPYGNYNNNYRSWTFGDPTGKASRHITIVAHSNVTKVPENKLFNSPLTREVTEIVNGVSQTRTENIPFAVTRVTLEMPPTTTGSYYTIEGGIKVDEANGDLHLTQGAFIPDATSYNNTNFNTESDLTNRVTGSWNCLLDYSQAGTPPYSASAMATEIKNDPTYFFGLAITSGGTFATGDNACPTGRSCNTTTTIASNNHFTGANGYTTSKVSTETNSVPKLDVYLTYSTEFTSTVNGDITFTMKEYDASNNYKGDIEVTITISTVLEEFRNQRHNLLAMYNEMDNHTFTRKVVLPASLQRRDLYLTSIYWEPHPELSPVGEDTREDLFHLTGKPDSHTDLPNTNQFALKLTPTEQISASLTSTLGWYNIDNAVDVFATAKTQGKNGSNNYLADKTESYYSNTKTNAQSQTVADSVLLYTYHMTEGDNPRRVIDNPGIKLGTLDGRASAAMDLTLYFNGDLVYPYSDSVGKVVLGFDYYTKDQLVGHFDATVIIRTRDKGDTIYMATGPSVTRNGLTVYKYETAPAGIYDYNTPGWNTGNKGKEPNQFLNTFSEVFLDGGGVYQDGDVICILDNLVIGGTENDMVRGSKYYRVPVVRYSGNHWQLPGAASAYTGTMITVCEKGRLSVDYMTFDGSMVAKQKKGYATDNYDNQGQERHPADDMYYYEKIGWEPTRVVAKGPIFEVKDDGQLTLGEGTIVQNNYNDYYLDNNGNAVGVPGGAIYVHKAADSYNITTGTGNDAVTTTYQNPEAKLILNNTVNIRNILVNGASPTGAIHVDVGNMSLGTAKEGTKITIDSNYVYGGQYWIDATSRYKVDKEGISGWQKANVYLTRTAPTTGNTTIEDVKNDFIRISTNSPVAADTRIGVSKWFPANRDTIQFARVDGSRQQHAEYAKKNDNFFNDSNTTVNYSKANVFYHATISPLTLYFQRCETFKAQDNVSSLDYLVYDDNHVLLTRSNGTQLPQLDYKLNRYAACPDQSDSVIYSVHGGFYPYKYSWSRVTSGAEPTLEEYFNKETPYSNVQVNNALLQTTPDFNKATASNSSTAPVPDRTRSMKKFNYNVTATDLAGCTLTKNFDVKMTFGTEAADADHFPATSTTERVTYGIGDYAGIDTIPSHTAKATRRFNGLHLDTEVLPPVSQGEAAWGTISATFPVSDEFPTLTPVGNSLLCPGDSIYLKATAATDKRFIQWNFDPYDVEETFMVLPNLSDPDHNTVEVKAYFSPLTYWKDAVENDPGTSSFTTDYWGSVHIKNENGLAWLISLCNGLNYQQINDFFFDTVYIHAKSDNTQYDMKAHLWTPLGTAQHPFRGVLKVDPGVTINNIIVNEPQMENVGFFGYLDAATLEKLNINNSIFRGQQYVGGIAAQAVNTTLTTCAVADDEENETSTAMTIITSNYASGAFLGHGEVVNIDGGSAKAKFMGATIYNGGVAGYLKNSSVSNSTASCYPNSASLYSGGVAGFVETTPAPGKDRAAGRIVNNYVHYLPGSKAGTRSGGLVGYAKNTTLANNYVYGRNTGASVSGALGGVLGEGVHVENCFYEQGFDNQAFGFYSNLDTTAVGTFSRAGSAAILTDTLGQNVDLARQLNRWAYAHGNGELNYWHNDTGNVNNGYPVFGEPEYEPFEATRELATCDSLLVAGLNFTTSGTYYFHVVDSAEFTDTAVTLYLTVNYSELTEVSDTIRKGEGYEGHGFSFTAKEIELMMQTIQEEGAVTVVVSDTLQTETGCDSIVTLYLTVSSTLSTPNSQLSTTLKVYPNPTTKSVTVEADGLQQVELYDAVSRRLDVITSSRDNVITADLEAYPAGPYYLRIRTENGTVIKKVIKR